MTREEPENTTPMPETIHTQIDQLEQDAATPIAVQLLKEEATPEMHQQDMLTMIGNHLKEASLKEGILIARVMKQEATVEAALSDHQVDHQVGHQFHMLLLDPVTEVLLEDRPIEAKAATERIVHNQHHVQQVKECPQVELEEDQLMNIHLAKEAVKDTVHQGVQDTAQEAEALMVCAAVHQAQDVHLEHQSHRMKEHVAEATSIVQMLMMHTRQATEEQNLKFSQ
jgi:hypothetical protein